MKIQNDTTRQANEALLAAKAKVSSAEQQAPKQSDVATQAAGGSAGPAATVQLSSRSRELHGALAKANAAPDVREDKVADVRRRLDAGTYVIDPTRIARGILDSQA